MNKEKLRETMIRIILCVSNTRESAFYRLGNTHMNRDLGKMRLNNDETEWRKPSIACAYREANIVILTLFGTKIYV